MIAAPTDVGPRRPSAEALDAAASVAARVSERSLQLRRSFVVAQAEAPGLPPLARLIRGGRGGEVRLKVYLSLLWFAANPPYDVTYPARAWAQLLDLPDVEVGGARRVSEALAWLAREKFIQLQPRPGLPSRVVLLNELGDGKPYVVPGAVWRTFDQVTTDLERQQQRYLRLPPALWTRGWLAILDAAALAMLLIVTAESQGDKGPRRVWFSPQEAAARYALSPTTRTKGLSQLTKTGIVTAEKIAAGRDAFDLRRTRNAFRLRLDRLEQPAEL